LGHIELIPISGCACENHKHYRPLDSNVVSYIRVAYIFKIIIIIHPYQALTFSPQNPDDEGLNNTTQLGSYGIFDGEWTAMIKILTQKHPRHHFDGSGTTNTHPSNWASMQEPKDIVSKPNSHV
jgi:hypothetical protein